MDLAANEEVGLALFRESNDAFIIFDLESLAVAAVNPACQRIARTSQQQLAGRCVTELIEGDSQELLTQFFSSLKSTHFFHSREGFRWRLDDGRTIPVNVSVSRIHAKPSPFGLLVLRDVSEREQAMENLRREAVFRKAIVDNAADGICVFHRIAEPPHVRFTVWNDRMAALTGYTMTQANQLGWDQALFTDAATRRRAQDRLARALRGDNLNAEEWNITNAKGEERVLGVSTSTFCTDDATIHVLSILQDLTELKRAEIERRELDNRMRQTQKLESLGVLAGGIAHGFNNLLMVILGNTDLAVEEVGSESPALPHLTEIETASRQAADLCRQLLAYAGKGRLIVEPLDLNGVLKEMTQMLRVSVSDKTTLQIDLGSGVPAIRADGTQLRQMIVNLVSNAAEAVADERGTISITTGATHCDQERLIMIDDREQLAEGWYATLEVRDTGHGMDANTRHKMFDPFFTTRFTGRGLGMAAVLGIVRSHKGSITVDSEIGRGTTITILLPAADQAAQQRTQPQAVAAPDFSGVTVLLVDDEQHVRAITEKMLRWLGIEVLTANDGRDALRIFREQGSQIDCVILDLTMPHMDGEQTFRELRHLDETVKVIISSGHDEHEVVQRFLGQGLAGFIHKPYKLAALKRAIIEVLG